MLSTYHFSKKFRHIQGLGIKGLDKKWEAHTMFEVQSYASFGPRNLSPSYRVLPFSDIEKSR